MNISKGLSVLSAGLLILAGCQPSSQKMTAPPVSETSFGVLPDGREVKIYTLENSHGMKVTLMDLGATILDLIVPDRNGVKADVSLGFNRPAPYLTESPYFGATVGRYANRINQGKFSLDGQSYQLAINNPPNTLHGGKVGFDKVVWKSEILPGDHPSLRFSRISADGEEGYPGNLTVSVTYTLTEKNELKISYEASTDKKTVLNLANHTYFNLAGEGNGSILDTVMTINADAYTPVNETLIPTGKIAEVQGTVMDFRQQTAIGARIRETGGNPIGYDHNYVLRKTGKPGDLEWAVTVYEPVSGREMKIYTDQPGVQFYSGNFLDGKITGKGGKPYLQYSAFALETQHFPDSPNQPNFPSTVLRPGETFRSTTIYAFGSH